MKTASPGRSHHMFADRLCVTCCCFAGLVLQAGLVTEHNYSLSSVRLAWSRHYDTQGSNLVGSAVMLGTFHLVKISGISGSAVNGTRFVGSSHWKIPRKSGKSKKVGPFSRLEFPNGMSCAIYVSRSLYQFQARLGTATYRGLRPNGTTFYQSEIPLLLPPKFPGFFPKWKAPVITKLIFVIFSFKNSVTRSRQTANRPSPAHVISPL